MVLSTQVSGLVDQMPELDASGKLTGPPREQAEQVYEQVLSGGRESIVELVGMLTDPEQGGDHKARYLLHGLAVYVGRDGADSQRKTLTTALGSTLAGNNPAAVKGFVVRQLQVAGGQEVAGALGALLSDETLCPYATQALLAIGRGAAEQLLAALPDSKGANRRSIVQALGELRAEEGLKGIAAALADEDRDTRLTAGWTLARIGDPASAAPLLNAADHAEGWERTEATNSCLLLAERLLASGHKQQSAAIYRRLSETHTGADEAHVREAAAAGLKRAVM